MLTQKKHIHFIGISGIGMSGIAKILKQQGHIISGCDSGIDQKHIDELQNLGCIISKQHHSSLCNDITIDTVVYTTSINYNHPELQNARAKNITIMHRAEMLAQIMSQKTSIAVAGSHGKTSTTSLIGHILLQAQLDPTIIVGGHIHAMQSNAYHGTGQYLVAESDESDRSFLRLPKTYSIVTNVDLEHLETYKDLDDIKETFLTFINNTPETGKTVLCIDDAGIQSIERNITAPYTTYGQSSQADIQAKNICLNADYSTFDIYQKSTGQSLGTIYLSQPGLHYVLNATGAIALALHLNIPFLAIQESLRSFSGVDRRFSYCGTSTLHKAHIFDDYGHHPLEIYYALQIARKKAQHKLAVVFQPHRFTRTKFLWDNFIQTFAQAPIDLLIITDIFPASEQPIESINSHSFVEELKKQCPQKHILYCPFDTEMQEIQHLLNQFLQKDDLLLLLGAGKVNKLAKKLTT